MPGLIVSVALLVVIWKTQGEDAVNRGAFAIGLVLMVVIGAVNLAITGDLMGGMSSEAIR